MSPKRGKRLTPAVCCLQQAVIRYSKSTTATIKVLYIQQAYQKTDNKSWHIKMWAYSVLYYTNQKQWSSAISQILLVAGVTQWLIITKQKTQSTGVTQPSLQWLCHSSTLN